MVTQPPLGPPLCPAASSSPHPSRAARAHPWLLRVPVFGSPPGGRDVVRQGGPLLALPGVARPKLGQARLL